MGSLTAQQQQQLNTTWSAALRMMHCDRCLLQATIQHVDFDNTSLTLHELTGQNAWIPDSVGFGIVTYIKHNDPHTVTKPISASQQSSPRVA
jgi:hypothetical protein